MDIAAAAAHAAIQRPLEVVRQRGEKKISGEKGEEGKGREGKGKKKVTMLWSIIDGRRHHSRHTSGRCNSHLSSRYGHLTA
jgi:hypothetical protein